MTAPAAAPPARTWPPGLAGSPVTAVIERAIEQGRLAHSLLLHGNGLETLVAVAEAIAGRLLDPRGRAPITGHPDCFALRPAGKSRQISADATRELIGRLQVSGSLGERKVAIAYEAERMNLNAANIFLKTLEEPPPHTTILVVSTHPFALLPTIRSRCCHYRFPVDPSMEIPAGEGWSGWLDSYRAWLERLGTGATTKRGVAEAVLGAYGLIARFDVILDGAVAAAWEKLKGSIPAELEEDERKAMETGISKGLQLKYFTDIEKTTGQHAKSRRAAADPVARRAFGAAIAEMERGARLLRLNLNESAVLENFLLSSLRLWSGR